MVLGAEVAQALGYGLGEKIVLAHGVATISLVKHDDKPFTVVGILERTGTPIDRTLHISLAGMEALHIDWQNGMPARGAAQISADQVRVGKRLFTSVASADGTRRKRARKRS